MKPLAPRTVNGVPDTRSRVPRIAGRAYGRTGVEGLRGAIRDRLAPALAATLKDEPPKAVDADTGISWRTVEGLKTGRHLPDFCGALAIALARPGSPFAREIRALLSGDALAQDPKTIDAILKGINHG
jgi:hypothetical protein